MPSEWFEEFAKQLLKEKGVKVPDEEVLAQLVKDISVRARDVVLSNLLDSMTSDELQMLEKATNSGDTRAADQLVAVHQPVITQTLAQFKNMYLGKA